MIAFVVHMLLEVVLFVLDYLAAKVSQTGAMSQQERNFLDALLHLRLIHNLLVGACANDDDLSLFVGSQCKFTPRALLVFVEAKDL